MLYCCALPLWEGFDEPFHYGYVETFLLHHELPVLGQTMVSLEISRSLHCVPLSRFLSAPVGGVSFEDWTKLPEAERLALAKALGAIEASGREQVSGLLNYEAQQAPLTYLLLTPIDYVLGPVQLRTRILLLRLGLALAAAAAMYWGLDRLAGLIELEEPWRAAAIFFALQTQMLWASVAHVGNDALAVPLTLWFVVWVGRVQGQTSRKSVFWLGAVLCAGLLTKAYFLSLAPLFVALLVSEVLRRRLTWKDAVLTSGLLLPSVPWYVRNIQLYGSLAGTQQAAKGIGLTQALAAIPHIPWISSIRQYANASLWTGNWSFLSFSRITIDCELLLLAAGLIAFVMAWRRQSHATWWTLAAGLLFACGLAYQTCVTWVESHGQALYPEPWYAQGILAALVVFCFAGLRSAALWGRGVAATLTVLASWVAVATWAAKLMPFYGAGITRANLRSLWEWWTNHPAQDLQGVMAAPIAVVLTLLGLYLLVSLGAAAGLCHQLLSRAPRNSTPQV